MSEVSLSPWLDYSAKRQNLFEELLAKPSGLEWSLKYSVWADQVWQDCFDRLDAEFPTRPLLAIVATGGYGRRELSPGSDLDVVAVPEPGREAEADQAVSWLYRQAIEAFKPSNVRLGYAYRWVKDLPGLDDKSLAGLLESRLVVGSQEPYRALMDSLWRDFPVAEFLVSKVAERERDWAKTHSTPLVTEPDLKKGAGGLRCFQHANWIGAALGERLSPPTPDYNFVLRARNLLHLLTRPENNHLSFHSRVAVAEALGMEPLVFGEELTEHLIALHQTYRSAREKIRENRFLISPHVQALRGQVRLEVGCSAGEAANAISLGLKLGLEVPKTRVRVLREADSSVLSALFAGERTLRALDEAGVLEPLLPELTRCRTLLPTDSSHQFTVFEHTLQTIANLDRADQIPFLAGVKATVSDLGPLYLAALLHDCGKADPSGPHSDTGADMAMKACARLKLDTVRTSMVVWLVQEHLSLAQVLRNRDVMNHETAADFARFVGTKEHLDCLTLLTWADVNAVNDGIWTPVQDEFLGELYRRTVNLLEAENISIPKTEAIRRSLIKQLRREDVPHEDLMAFIESLPGHYLLSTKPEMVSQHLKMARKAQEGLTLVDTVDYQSLGVTDLTITSPDQPGHLTRILGVLYAHDLSLIGLRAASTKAPNAVLVDEFTVSSSGRSLSPKTATELAEDLAAVLEGRLQVADLLISRGRDPERRQESMKVSYSPGTPGIIDFRAPKGRGMAFRLSRVIADQGWNILAARMGAWAGLGTAAFYVVDAEGKGPDLAAVRSAFDVQEV